jgi:site-specific recombinase XerD
MDHQQLLDRLETDLKLRNRARSTHVGYLKNAKRYLEFIDCPIDETDEEDIRGFIESLIEIELMPTTTNHYLSAVLFLYEVTLNRPMNRRQVPFMRIKQKAVDLFGRSEIAAIIQAAGSLRNKAMFMLAYGGGLRLSEIARLKTSDIDANGMRIHVVDSKRGKSRYTLLPQACLDTLRAYWAHSRPAGTQGFLFPQGKDPERPIYTASIQKVFNAALARSGTGRRASLHTLRHCFATHLLEGGCDLFTIKELMGHASITSTSRYLHLANVGAGITSPLDELLGGGCDV